MTYKKGGPRYRCGGWRRRKGGGGGDVQKRVSGVCLVHFRQVGLLGGEHAGQRQVGPRTVQLHMMPPLPTITAPAPPVAGKRQDNRAAARPRSMHQKGWRFFADDEDLYGLEDILQVGGWAGGQVPPLFPRFSPGATVVGLGGVVV